MSTFNVTEEYPKLLHEFELAEQRIAELEAELGRRTKSRDMWRSEMKDMCSGERSLIKELEAERDNLRKACEAFLAAYKEGRLDRAIYHTGSIHDARRMTRKALGHD